jgi:hypothetical protein
VPPKALSNLLSSSCPVTDAILIYNALRTGLHRQQTDEARKRNVPVSCRPKGAFPHQVSVWYVIFTKPSSQRTSAGFTSINQLHLCWRFSNCGLIADVYEVNAWIDPSLWGLFCRGGILRLCTLTPISLSNCSIWGPMRHPPFFHTSLFLPLISNNVSSLYPHSSQFCSYKIVFLLDFYPWRISSYVCFTLSGSIC